MLCPRLSGPTGLPLGNDAVIPPGPRPDKASITGKIVSATHRYATNMGVVDARIGRKFKEFAKTYILRYIRAIDPLNVMTFDEWVAKYPSGRRKLFKSLRENDVFTERDWNIQSFIKDECYAEIKPPRSVNHMADLFAAYLGTAQTLADKALFASINDAFSKFNGGASGFVKGTNPATWGARQDQLFEDGPVSTTDFTSFEAHHRGVFAEVVAFWLNHALRPLGLPCSIRHLIYRAVMGDNHVRMTGVRILTHQSLMSGNLWTSSANGLLNLLINSFLFVYEEDKSIEDMVKQALSFKILVEGDDAIFQYHQRNRHLIDKMGLRYKIEDFPNYGVASFCSTYISGRTGKAFCEPKKMVQKFYTLPMECDNDKIDKHMMRAKALSYGTLYPHEPIVADVCADVLNRTRGYDCRKQLSILREREYKFNNQINVLNFKEIGGANIRPTDRLDFQDMFNIPVYLQHRVWELLDRPYSMFWAAVLDLDDHANLTHAARQIQSVKTVHRSHEDLRPLLKRDIRASIPDWSCARPCILMRAGRAQYDE